MCAVFGPAERAAEIVVEIAPPACVKIVATSLSAPVSIELRRGRDRGRGAEDVPRERDGVDAEVEQGAAAELERVEAVRGVGRDALGVVGEQRADLAEGARRDDLADADHVRQVARPHRLHREQALRRARRRGRAPLRPP